MISTGQHIRNAVPALLGVGLFLAAAAGPAAGADGTRVIWSFEKTETAKSLPQFGYWAEPTPIRYPAPGWRGKKLGPDHEGDITAVRKASSRDYPLMTLTATHVAHGDYAYRYRLTEKLHKRIADWIRKTPGGTACPPPHDYHDRVNWYWQRCPFGRYLWRHQPANRDWSSFDRFRFDVFSTRATAVLGVKVRDRIATKGRPGPHPHGVRTPPIILRVPPGKAVTCDLPLAEIARVCELDLTRIHRYHIRINGTEGATDLYFDHVRLVTADVADKDAALPLVSMEGEPKPWGRPVVYDGPTPRSPEKLKRQAGPVESLGPVVVTDSPGNYACAPGHFGGVGVTYFQSARRSCVAYDNDRLAVVMGGGPKDAKLMSRGVGEGGGVYVFASFDGGKTWGAPARGERKPHRYGNWYWRGNMYSDRNGDIYWLGTQNCDSYHEGYDVLFRRLAFTGDAWVADRVACVDQNGYKCPGWASVIRTRQGRLWAAWRDGFRGDYAKHSNDDGCTWQPCKDASLDPPRPFYEPKLENLGRPAVERPAPPKAVLLWPAEPVCGDFLLPFQNHVAVLSANGARWQVHDGRAWGPPREGPFGKIRKARGVISATVLGETGLFVSRFEIDKLKVARLRNGTWTTDVLDSGAVPSNILTASGDNVFCFYIVKDGETYHVKYRRWADERWEPTVTLASEKVSLNQVAAPVFCPPDYAAVWWDQRRPKQRGATSFVKFMRVANR
jgi:hypothetical protein